MASAQEITSLLLQLTSVIADIESKDVDIRVQEVYAFMQKNTDNDKGKLASTILEALQLFLQKLATKTEIYLQYSAAFILDDLDDFVNLLHVANRGENTTQQKMHIRSIYLVDEDELRLKLSKASLLNDILVDSVVKNELPADLDKVVICSSDEKEVFSTKIRGTSVAVKLLKPPKAGIDPKILEVFRKEIKIATTLSSQNIVQVLGAYASNKGLAIVMELMGGHLRQLLASGQLEMQIKLRIATEVANGLTFLHSNKPTILHRNLSSQKVLFTNLQEKHCKLSGFGVAKFVTDPSSYVAGQASKGTTAYKAPELWSLKNPQYSEKSDVYAFGVLLWEIMGQKDPRAGLRSEEIASRIKKGELEDIPAGTPENVAEIIKKCLALKPEGRPTMAQISSELQALVKPVTSDGDEVTKLRAEIVRLKEIIEKQAAQIAALSK